jgi:hypothetical protein
MTEPEIGAPSGFVGRAPELDALTMLRGKGASAS